MVKCSFLKQCAFVTFAHSICLGEPKHEIYGSGELYMYNIGLIICDLLELEFFFKFLPDICYFEVRRRQVC